LQRLIVAEADISPIRSALVSDVPLSLQQLADFYHRWERGQSR
jgi:hypothetical protein